MSTIPSLTGEMAGLRPLLSIVVAGLLLAACGSPLSPATEGAGSAAVAVSGGGVTVDVVSTGPRTGGFYGAVRIANTSFPSSITSFQVVFSMPGASASGGSAPGGSVTITGPDTSGNYTAKSTSFLSYQPIAAGQSRDFRFNGTGTFTSSTIVSVRINGQALPIGGADQPPAVSLSSTATSITAASTITLTAAASDDKGVSRVEFYEGGTLLGSDTSAPYTQAVAFTSASNGTHTYTARAYDTAGQATTSAAVTVTVSIGGAVSGVSINAGGSATGSFLSDEYYNGGTAYTNSNTVDISQITSNAPPAAIFNTERYGAFSYTIPDLGAGTAVSVTLYFAETYLSGAGQRSFDVTINGVTVLSGFDIYAAAGGSNRGIARTFDATANTSGQVVIQFVAGVQNPKVNGLAVTPVGGDRPPTVSLASSASSVATTDAITLTATASDDRGVNKVEFYEGTTLLGTDTTAPYTQTVSFTSASNGTHTYTAKAYDTIGQATTSSAVSVTVNIGGTDRPPTVSLASSASSVTATGAITLTATASDDHGVNKVEFYEGTTLLGTDTTAPYTQTVSFTSASNGTHTYTAKAYDTVGQVTASSPVSVTVAINGGTGPVVSLIQSSRANATDITQDDINTMVSQAVDQAGGLGFITNGMTVVLKPNLLTRLSGCWGGTATLSPFVNGVTTDWRVVRAVAELVRARNPSGRILVMEGSTNSTPAAYQTLGYTTANFGSTVDQFIALEGSGCNVRDTSGLVQRAGASGKQYWLDAKYASADVIISVAALKTHGSAGITGCVKNLGIGATPAATYSVSGSSTDCTRNQTQSGVSSFINHSSPSALGEFIADFVSTKPPDFAVMDGLQGLQNGPCSTSSADRMNMRLILASRNAVALDAVASRVMSCDPAKVPTLTRAEAYGMGTIDASQISVVGNKQIADVKKLFKSGVAGVCQ